MSLFKQIYFDSLKDSNPNDLEFRHSINSKPKFYKGFISPESKIDIYPQYDMTFSLDESGMEEVISIFQTFWDSLEEVEKKNLIYILTGISNSINEYFSSKSPKSNTDIFSAYLYSPNGHLTLSEIKGMTPGFTPERTVIANQLLHILSKSEYLTNFKPSIVSTTLSTKAFNRRLPHSIILLENLTNSDNNYLYDINCPMAYLSDDNKSSEAIALFQVDQSILDKFSNGQKIMPKSIYELAGLKSIEFHRIYGDSSRIILNDEEPVF